ncbi:hypothetical protein ACPUEJ_23090 (plasmid) [Vibrio tubiashii]|uniref:hypothetical protein n=1 Tax=Vibrio tubiashii TaxID=29498 RepID=UPI003CE54795
MYALLRLLIVFVGLWVTSMTYASDVEIKTTSSLGQGVLYAHNGQCYVVTPAHVMDGETRGTALTAGRQHYPVTLLHTFEVDLAILRFDDIAPRCDKSPQPLNELDKVLTVVRNGEVLTKLNDASTLRTPIEVVGIDETEYLQIKASDQARPFKQGFSGSALYIANSISGVLLEVEDGYGYVYRYDAMMERLKEYFGVDDGVTVQAEQFSPLVISEQLAGEQKKEWTLSLKKNSPIIFDAGKRDSRLEYKVEIFDPDEQRVFNDTFYASSSYRYTYTPQTEGEYLLRVTGLHNQGSLHLEIMSYTTDTQLTGDANTIVIGDTIRNKLAYRSVATYRVNATNNSPIEFLLIPKDSNLEYDFEILNSDGQRQFVEDFYAKSEYRFAFTPKSNDLYTLKFTGAAKYGEFEIRTKQYHRDSRLRSAANIIEPGDKIEDKLARNSVAEYRISLKRNSPVEFLTIKRDSPLEYDFEIFDSEGKRHFVEDYYAKSEYRFAFTPLLDDVYTLKFTGKHRHGAFALKLKQYNTDSQLRGKGHTLQVGESMDNKLADNTVAEYQMRGVGNSPIEFQMIPVDSNLEYDFEIFDEQERRLFKEDYYAKAAYRFAFTPQNDEWLTFRLTGIKRHGRVIIKTKQYNHDSQLRGKGHALSVGESIDNKLATNSIAEYFIQGVENSPVEFIMSPVDSNLEYDFEIFDENEQRLFKEDYYAKTGYRVAYTPEKNGRLTIRLTGIQRHGRVLIKTKQYNLDSQLRGGGHTVYLGDVIKNKMASKAVAEYQLQVDAGTQIEFLTESLDSPLEYDFELFSSNGKRLFKEDYYASKEYRFAFTPPQSDTLTIRFTGLSRHGSFKLKVK